jgi:CheY-like chemotaxis protein
MSLDSTVLVVDDDLQVLEVAATACEEIGLNVLRAEDGAPALRVLNENPDVDLLLTDISMPNMTGWELAHKAKQKHPGLKVIYVSGFIKTLPFGQHGLGYGPLLAKPWRGSQLHDQIRAVLGLQF